MAVQTISPTASNHDAWETGAGVLDTADEMKITAGTAWCGMFLPAVTITGAATINSATLFYKPSGGAHDDPDIDWYGHDTDNSSVFAGASNISSRTRTTAVTQDTGVGIGTASFRQVDITDQVAEITARGGWASGNNMALIGDARSGSCDVWIDTYDTGGGTTTWYVEIDYTEPVGSGVPLKTIYYARLRE